MSDNHLITDDMTDDERKEYDEQLRDAIAKHNEYLARFWAEVERRNDEYIRTNFDQRPAAQEDGADAEQ